MLFTNKKAVALDELDRKCVRMDFSLEVIILDEYNDEGISKIQLQHESDGYSMITLTENSNLDTRIPENYL